jgi:hypothetical protein
LLINEHKIGVIHSDKYSVIVIINHTGGIMAPEGCFLRLTFTVNQELVKLAPTAAISVRFASYQYDSLPLQLAPDNFNTEINLSGIHGHYKNYHCKVTQKLLFSSATFP